MTGMRVVTYGPCLSVDIFVAKSGGGKAALAHDHSGHARPTNVCPGKFGRE